MNSWTRQNFARVLFHFVSLLFSLLCGQNRNSHSLLLLYLQRVWNRIIVELSSWSLFCTEDNCDCGFGTICRCILCRIRGNMRAVGPLILVASLPCRSNTLSEFLFAFSNEWRSFSCQGRNRQGTLHQCGTYWGNKHWVEWKARELTLLKVLQLSSLTAAEPKSLLVSHYDFSVLVNT